MSTPGRDVCLQEIEALRIELSNEPYHAKQAEIRKVIDEWLERLTEAMTSSLISSG